MRSLALILCLLGVGVTYAASTWPITPSEVSFTQPGIIGNTNDWSRISVNPLLMRNAMRLPVMGVDPWLVNGPNSATATNLKSQIDMAKTNGWTGLGYRLVIVTDGWQATNRGPAGTVTWDTNKFPLGMKELCDYGHSNGCLVGIYTEPAITTSAGFPGTTNTMMDASNIVAWGFDYVQFDNPMFPRDTDNDEIQIALRTQFISYLQAMAATNGGRSIVIRGTGNSTGNKWDTHGLNIELITPAVYGDFVGATNIVWMWEQFKSNFHNDQSYSASVGPGHIINSIGFIEDFTLLYGLKVAFSFASYFAISPSQLLWNLFTVPGTYPTTDRIMTNALFIAINQDPLVCPPVCVKSNQYYSVWVRPLVNNCAAVWAINWSTNVTATNAFFTLNDIGMSGRVPVYAQDVWFGTNCTISAGWTNNLAPYESTLFWCSYQAVLPGLTLNGPIVLSNPTNITATAGTATLPVNPSGFISLTNNGKLVKIPYYEP